MKEKKTPATIKMLKARVAQLERALRQQTARVQALTRVHDAQPATDRPAYRQLVEHIRRMVQKHLPRNATVIVVNKGDPDLLKLRGRIGWHFPQHSDGAYAGYHPTNSLMAIVQLEVLRSKGADFLLFPQTAFWWLDHYVEFARFLKTRYREVARLDHTCLIFSLRDPTVSESSAVCQQLEELLTECAESGVQEPATLDWDTGEKLAGMSPHHVVFSPSCSSNVLPYFDASVDIVALASDEPTRLAEARRVARHAVVRLTRNLAAKEMFATAIIERKNVDAAALPAVSIIIPCHNGLSMTEACLRSLFETLPGNFRGEIIVVDDASTDGTSGRLQAWARNEPRLRVLRNEQNAGFVRSCNHGAGAATGEILLFLNNDTLLLPGWLPPLLHVFEEHADAGGVGGKLLFPDGRLQEAGGVIFCDGSADHFGREDQASDAPAYNFVRKVDYCSAALLATKRSLFSELGGFDVRFTPGYYEDTDYCFNLRAHGHRVYYQPESVIVHFEGGTAGTDLAEGPKRYQVLNQTKFVEKWAAALAERPARWSRRDARGLQTLMWPEKPNAVNYHE